MNFIREKTEEFWIFCLKSLFPAGMNKNLFCFYVFN